ncbi:MAG: hypothetical protein KZQ95_13740 [Candidatus Thiodiazotropha sp. (ex Epidulcina cf. delphinae)]|nr:hypothetical protein [Candidatus Thiodiazotropha sp. (ex Epidulcina cf. delphinae)]
MKEIGIDLQGQVNMRLMLKGVCILLIALLTSGISTLDQYEIALHEIKKRDLTYDIDGLINATHNQDNDS